MSIVGMLPKLNMRLPLTLVILLSAAFAQKEPANCAEMILDQSIILREALAAACIGATDIARAPADLDAQITRYAVLNTSLEFVIAYYNGAEGAQPLSPPLRILHFWRSVKSWGSNEFPNSDLRSATLPVGCAAPVSHVHRAGLFFIVGTHLAPSTDCLLILDTELKLKDVRYGTFVAALSGEMIYEHVGLHFGPTYPLVISLYDPAAASTSAGDKQIYPPDSDAFHSDFIDQLSHLAAFERCEGNGCSSRPEEFETTREDTAVNERTHSFAFVALYSPMGYIRVENVKDSELNQRIIYVYRFNRGSIDHREFPQSEMKSLYGTESLNDLLAAKILLRIFE